MSQQQQQFDPEAYEDDVQTLVYEARNRVRQQGDDPARAARRVVERYLSQFPDNQHTTWTDVNSVAPDPPEGVYDRLKRQHSDDLDSGDYPRLKATTRVFCDVFSSLQEELE